MQLFNADLHGNFYQQKNFDISRTPSATFIAYKKKHSYEWYLNNCC